MVRFLIDKFVKTIEKSVELHSDAQDVIRLLEIAFRIRIKKIFINHLKNRKDEKINRRFRNYLIIIILMYK